MIKLLSLIGTLAVGASTITPLIVTNENIKEKIIDNNKKQAMDFTQVSIVYLTNSLHSTDINTKLRYIQQAYPSVSVAYDFLNNVEHTQDIILAKSSLLEGAEWIDQAARQGNTDTMNAYVGNAIFNLSNALKRISYPNNDNNKKQAMDFTQVSIVYLTNSLHSTDINTKLRYIQQAYPSVSIAYDFLNNVEHTQDIILAKSLLLEGAEWIDQAARQGNTDTMNAYVGNAIFNLSNALKHIGFSVE